MALAASKASLQNWIGGNNYSPMGADFVPPPPDMVPALLDDLMDLVSGAHHAALVQAAIAHAQFETIHPFPDGNGRVGRALIHAILRRRGVTRAPILPVSTVLYTLSERYVDGLTAYRDGRVAQWVEFFVDAADTASDEAVVIADDVAALRGQWDEQIEEYRRSVGKARALRKDSAEYKILRGLPAVPLLTEATAMREYGIPKKASAQTALEALKEAGILRKKEIGDRTHRVTGYFADDIFRLIDAASRELASTMFDTRVSPPTGRAVPRTQ